MVEAMVKMTAYVVAFGIILMIAGLITGITAIIKTIGNHISPMRLALCVYGGLFIALIGAILIGRGV